MGHQTLEQKQRIVEQVRERLERTNMLVAAPLFGLKHRQLEALRTELPGDTKCQVVKNTLMREASKALDGTDVTDAAGGNGEKEEDEDSLRARSVLRTLLKQSRLWLFIAREEDIKPTLEAYQAFLRKHKIAEQNGFRGGFLDGRTLDGDDVRAVSELPSKRDLYRQIAVGVKMVPTKVARGVNAVPSKVARAIKLAVADEGDGALDAAETKAGE